MSFAKYVGLAFIAVLACTSEAPLEDSVDVSGSERPSKTDGPQSLTAGSTTDAGDASTGSDIGSTDAEEDEEPCAEGDLVCAGLWGPGCEEDGCIRAFQWVAHVSAAELELLVPPTTVVDNGYDIFRFTYWTAGRENLAVMTVPDVASPPQGFGVVVNNHGTTGLDDACALAPTDVGIGLAATFGARGMIGVAPDYPGLGTSGWLPYLVSAIEGAAALDAVRAGLLAARALDADVSGRAAVVGLSQGGHATLAAAQIHANYAPELDVRAFGAVAPASVWLEQWQSGLTIDGPHLAFHAMLVFAWSVHYGVDPGLLFAPELGDVGALMQQHCYAHPNGSTLAAVLSHQASSIFTPAFLEAYTTGSWTGPFAAFEAAFAANRVVSFAPTAPVRIWQGTFDSIIPEFHTTQMVETLKNEGMELEYTLVPGGEHTDVAFSFLAAPQLRGEESLAWLRALL